MAAQSAQNGRNNGLRGGFQLGIEWMRGDGKRGATVTDTSSLPRRQRQYHAISLSSLTPCITMKNMASPPITTGTNTISYFYADTSSSSSGCTDSAHTVSTISDIFGAISANFTTPRLLPNNSGGVVISTITN